jgi:energy-coupling factor transporter ATP-binding protein EcfA2
MSAIDIHNTFSPGQEILDPNRFAGRKSVIEQGIKALCRAGASILVYGERGVGKSSFIEMIKLIAQDQVELIYRYKLRHLIPQSGFQYKVISIQCDADVNNTEKVLQRLITSPEGISGLIGPRISTIETTTKDHFTLNLLKQLVSIGSSCEEKLIGKEFTENSIYELFTNLILLIVQRVLGPDEGLLMVIDEFDRVGDNSKMASMIKTLSKNKVKFLISGIAESYIDLIGQHGSIERQLSEGKIKINPMTEEEIEWVFELASGNSKGFIQFEKAFKEEVIVRSYGFPYYVQLFGQLALDHFVKVYGQGKKIYLTRDHLMQGLKDFAEYEPKLEQIYLSAIGDDPARELLLKGLSLQLPSRILQNNVFQYCQKRGLELPKPVLAVLLSFRNPQFLIRVNQEIVSFVDPLFKIYASIRIPVFLKEEKDGYCLN